MALLFHYGPFQPLWQQPGLIQAGPRLTGGTSSVQVRDPGVQRLQESLASAGMPARGVLLHYSDPFLLRAQPLRGLNHWCGPRLLVCGDLHHGERPLDVLAAYLDVEPHDGVLLSFNPAMLGAVRQRLRVPVRALPPTFFRYPAAERVAQPRLELLHVGSLGPHHPRRRELVLALQARGVRRYRKPVQKRHENWPSRSARNHHRLRRHNSASLHTPTGNCSFTGPANKRAMPVGSLMSRQSSVEPMNSSV